MARRVTKKSATMRMSKARASGGTDQLYTLEVLLVSGPMTERSVEDNPTVCRTIQIRSNQTLEDLHEAIFDAFDREEEHMYEFQIGGKGPMDPEARRYVLPMAREEPDGDDKPTGDVTLATIGSLGLKVDDAFGYWFDFGDDWWHQIDVVGVEEETGNGKCPRVIKRVGESPPQYVDWDGEDEI